MQMTIAIEPIPQALTANEKRVKELLDQSKTMLQIAYKLHMSFEAVRDAIFEIRKKEIIMARGKSLTEEQKARIMELHNAGEKQLAISLEVGCSQSSVANVIYAANNAQQEPAEPAEQTADTAPDDIITEQTGLPHCVWDALDEKICAINLEIQDRELHISELQAEIDRLVTDREQIRAWMEAHE